jgi:hypothetical protein
MKHTDCPVNVVDQELLRRGMSNCWAQAAGEAVPRMGSTVARAEAVATAVRAENSVVTGKVDVGDGGNDAEIVVAADTAAQAASAVLAIGTRAHDTSDAPSA